ncbi:MAG: glutamine--fructose-6-phosphate transaminase (isomerizing) [Clostridiales bacterium]|nr:glutamine--fructose-6-phosphate transaminase (isomerizing) [Clostridiales bacterium]
MCGIVGYIGNKDCADVLVDGLEKLEYRGYDSAGIAVFEKGLIKTVKTKGKLEVMKNKLISQGKPQGHCGIGHTRWASHGEPSDINSHPHSNGRVCIVHNGIIENYTELKEFLMSKGYIFISQTDSEVVASFIDYYYSDSNPFNAIKNAIQELTGSFALGIIFNNYPNRIYAVRKESPLIVGKGEDEAFIASDIPAILRYTKEYYLLENEEIALLEGGDIKIFDIHGDIIEKPLQIAKWDVSSAQKNGFPHFMLKEIHEQPEAIVKTISPRIKNGMPDFSEINLTDKMLSNYSKIHIVACGTAMYAGIVGKYAIEKLARIPVSVEVASEFRYNNPIVCENDLVIIISQSGETADTIAAMRLAKEKGADIVAIVNVQYSTISREADMSLQTWAGPEIAVASTKCYTVQLCMLYLLAFRFAFAKKLLSEDECKALTSTLSSTPKLIEKMLSSKENVQYIASKLINAEHIFFLGRGLDYALSLEGSLKLKEISYIHSEAYAAGELKHGTISLIEKGIPIISIFTQQNIISKTISNIEEVKARGADVIAVVSDNIKLPEGLADFIIKLPSTSDILMPIPAVVALQLLAYYTSVLKGIDADKPRNLAKSVTIE